MQEQIKKDIKQLVNEEIEIEEQKNKFTESFRDNELVVQNLKENYEKLRREEPKNLVQKAKELFNQYVLSNEGPTIGEQRTNYITQLETIARDCSKALVKGGKAKRQVQDLDEKISDSLMSDKENYLKLSNYLRKLEDAINYTQDDLKNSHPLEEEEVLKSQLSVLKNKKEMSYRKIDQISIRVNHTSRQKKQIREYLNYAETQSYNIEQTVQTAEYTIAFLTATEDLSEFLKAGSYAAQLHSIFDDSKRLTGKTDELFINALDSLGGLDALNNEDFALKDANNEANNKLHNRRVKRISEAKIIIDAI